jgi:hypothetical protein
MAVDTDHWGVLPSTVADAMVSAMEILLYTEASGQGCVRQVARIEGATEEQIKRACALGTPALFVLYAGTKYSVVNVDQAKFRGDMAFRILACATSWLTKVRRLGGDASIDYTAITDPKDVGVEELSEWGSYLALRGASDLAGLSNCRLERAIPGELLDAGLWVGAVDLVVNRHVDVYDDEPTATLESIGLVHSPDDPNALWTDPPTDSDPNTSDWGDEVDGGHYQLEDE